MLTKWSRMTELSFHAVGGDDEGVVVMENVDAQNRRSPAQQTVQELQQHPCVGKSPTATQVAMQLFLV